MRIVDVYSSWVYARCSMYIAHLVPTKFLWGEQYYYPILQKGKLRQRALSKITQAGGTGFLAQYTDFRVYLCLIISITFIKTYLNPVCSSNSRISPNAFSPLWGPQTLKWKLEQTPTLTRSISDATCSHSDLLWSKYEWHEYACDGGLFLKCTCVFWSLIWVVSVLVCLRTPGLIDLHRWPRRHGALDGAVDGGCGKSVLLFSVQACGKPWTWLFPVSLSWYFRSGPCGPMAWECDFSPVHLVTAFVGPKSLAEKGAAYSLTHLIRCVLSTCYVPGIF